MLTWNVYVGSFNKRVIEVQNVFGHSGFLEDCKKAARKYKDDKEAFSDAIRTSMMYYYWCKCEWEVIISHWPPNDKMENAKVDVYSQVNMNWDHFIDYVWENKKELAKRDKRDEGTTDVRGVS